MLYDAVDSKFKLFCSCNFYIFVFTLFNKDNFNQNLKFLNSESPNSQYAP